MIQTKYPIRHFAEPINEVSEIPDKISNGIRKTVEDFILKFQNLGEIDASAKPNPDKWSIKEILGHLIDSAANNHQRFVRAQYENSNKLISYEQNEWVKIEKHNDRSWKELIFLWQFYNLHLAHLISKMPQIYLSRSFTIGSDEPVGLGYIIIDYLGHMQHHIDQIEKKTA
ncbi:MAG TPA: DinB family protein [Ignavibacteriaceae bacterium]|nr:DinB family protein [Ignavibacteriaceae bacterium]